MAGHCGHFEKSHRISGYFPKCPLHTLLPAASAGRPFYGKLRRSPTDRRPTNVRHYHLLSPLRPARVLFRVWSFPLAASGAVAELAKPGAAFTTHLLFCDLSAKTTKGYLLPIEESYPLRRSDHRQRLGEKAVSNLTVYQSRVNLVQRLPFSHSLHCLHSEAWNRSNEGSG